VVDLTVAVDIRSFRVREWRLFGEVPVDSSRVCRVYPSVAVDVAELDNG
jgi:hypothetical protein